MTSGWWLCNTVSRRHVSCRRIHRRNTFPHGCIQLTLLWIYILPTRANWLAALKSDRYLGPLLSSHSSSPTTYLLFDTIKGNITSMRLEYTGAIDGSEALQLTDETKANSCDAGLLIAQKMSLSYWLDGVGNVGNRPLLNRGTVESLPILPRS